MDEAVQQQIKARIAELPEDVQKAILSADLDKRIQTVGNKHHLHIDQIGKLEDETLLVMLAFSDPNEFVGHLEGGLGVSRAEAESIANDVGNDIFMPIRESMKEYAQEKALLETLVEEQKTPDMPPTPSASKLPSLNSTPAPVTTPAAPPTPAPKPQVPLAPHPHDLMLVEKTVTTPAATPKTQAAAPPAATPPPAKPAGYKADPYREPPV